MAKNAHIGRLLALSVIAALAGCGGYAAYHNVEATSATSGPPLEPAAAPTLETTTVSTGEPAALAPPPGTVRTASARNFGPAAVNPHLQFLVQLQGEPAQTLPQLHRQDARVAQSAFEDMAREHPELRELRLLRISYRGRATLEFTGDDPADAEAADRLSAEIVERLSTLDFVRYAEPDLASWR